MKEILHHLFIPRESNNHRAKLLHHSTLFIYIAAFIIGQFIVSYLSTNHSQVLGISTNISLPVLLDLTNKEREKEGLNDLTMNSQLSEAAEKKAEYMFAHNFWAHNAPDGTTPWVFFKNAGYNYLYAGENLARGFSTSEDVVQAWMDSPTHRQNVLSRNYKEIGFAVKEGRLLGEDTVLIVEMFGSTTPPEAEPIIANPEPLGVSTANSPQVVKKPLIDGFSFTWNTTVMILVLFIFVLILDLVIVQKKRIVRLVGHNADHILFLGMLLVFVVLFTQGVIL